MNVASLAHCKELYALSGWDSPDVRLQYALPTDHAAVPHLVAKEPARSWPQGYWTSWPAYDADYLANKLRSYDFAIVNLNHETYSLTSDSLDDSDAAILGRSLAETLCSFAIELFNQGILTKTESGDVS